MVDIQVAGSDEDTEKKSILEAEREMFRSAYRMQVMFSDPNRSPAISDNIKHIEALKSIFKGLVAVKEPTMRESKCIFVLTMNPETAELIVQPVPLLPKTWEYSHEEIVVRLDDMARQFDFFRNPANKKNFRTFELLINCLLWYATKQIQTNTAVIANDVDDVIMMLRDLELEPSQGFKEIAAAQLLAKHRQYFEGQQLGVPLDPKSFAVWIESEDAEHALPIYCQKIRNKIRSIATEGAKKKLEELISALTSSRENADQRDIIYTCNNTGVDAMAATQLAVNPDAPTVARIDLLTRESKPNTSVTNNRLPAVEVGIDIPPEEELELEVVGLPDGSEEVHEVVVATSVKENPLPPIVVPMAPSQARRSKTDPQISIDFDLNPDTRKLFTIPPLDGSSNS